MASSAIICPRCTYPYAFTLKLNGTTYCPNCGYGDNSTIGVGTSL